MGAETGNRKGKIKPERAWVEYIVTKADAKGIPVLLKDSAELREVWGDPLPQAFPDELQPMTEDNSVPHCRGCLCAKVEKQGKRGESFTCTSTGEHVKGRYTRSSPPWCPKRSEKE